MKVRSNINAVDPVLQHNEKIKSALNIIGEKKIIGKKLRLSKETLRVLRDSDLNVVAGGTIAGGGTIIASANCPSPGRTDRCGSDNSRCYCN